jgi:glycosyltransferase involved in cell wall biosynthesis
VTEGTAPITQRSLPFGAKPLRVLFVSHDGDIAGAERTLVTSLTALDRGRFEPYLLVPFAGKLSRAASEVGIAVWVRQLVPWLPSAQGAQPRRRVSHLFKALRSLRARSWGIAHLILRNNIDVVYTNTATCVEGAIAARMTGRPHIWHIHESIRDNSDLMPILPLPFYSWAIDALSRSVIFCSNSLARCYPSLVAKATVVYNGLRFPALPDRTFAHDMVAEHVGIHRERKIVAVVGALKPRKDHGTFLEAAQRVLREAGDVAFLVVGSGPKSQSDLMREKIASLGIASSVWLTGWWPEEKVYDLLAGIDVLAISSEQEPFGLTAIEALAVETPVVSTRSGGPEEVILDGVTGLLVPIHDSAAMADAILRLLQAPRLARDLGSAGRGDVVARFNADRFVAGIQDILEQSVSLAKR